MPVNLFLCKGGGVFAMDTLVFLIAIYLCRKMELTEYWTICCIFI